MLLKIKKLTKMADATVIQLAPDSSVTNVITFEDAFGEHSELFGLSYNQRMARKRRRQARRLQRIRDRQERRRLRRQGRLEAEQERQAIKDDRAEHRYQRKHRHDNDENGSGDTSDGNNPPPTDNTQQQGGGGQDTGNSPQDNNNYQDNSGNQSSGNEYANDGASADDAPQGSSSDDSSQSSEDATQEEGDSSENFDGVMGAEDRFAEFSDSDTLQVHPSVQDLANKIEWNKELISRLEVQAAIARGKDESTDPIYNEINKRLLRITELENQLHGYANGLGNFSSANGCYCSYDGTFNIDTDSNFDGENLDNEDLMNAFDGDNLDNEELMSNVWGGGSSSEQSTQSDQSKAIRKVRAKRNYGRKASVNAAKSRAWKKRVETTGARLGKYNVVQGGKAIPIGHWKDKRGSIMLNVGDMVKVIGDHNKSYFKGVVSKNGMSNGKVYFIPKNILNSGYSQRPKYYQNRQGRAIQPRYNQNVRGVYQPNYNQNVGGRTFVQPQPLQAGFGSRGFAQGGGNFQSGSIYSNVPKGYTPVSASLRPIISPNRIEVTLNADGDIGKPTGVNGLDNVNDFDAPSKRIFELKSNADGTGSASTSKGLNFTGIAIGVGVAAVAVWALNKYKII